ncbi:hypothetical protein [Kurthia huakuii]|uniref:hypothetical protein n=1 Tax=Kurthia huakuii TaxID=1421019 RepID=UPI00049702AB|nr:hypothetical protein [Kurthia huakuii]MBM7700102.1 hypothetical protein [Kurthia huakuii]
MKSLVFIFLTTTIILSGCVSPTKTSATINYAYADIDYLRMSHDERTMQNQQLAYQQAGSSIKWSAQITAVDEHNREIQLQEMDLPLIKASFDYTFIESLEEKGYHIGDTLTFSDILHAYDAISDIWYINNCRIENSSKLLRQQLENYRANH